MLVLVTLLGAAIVSGKYEQMGCRDPCCVGAGGGSAGMRPRLVLRV